MILIRTGGKVVGMGSPDRRGKHVKKEMVELIRKSLSYKDILPCKIAG
jgi:hypothetical protein